MKAENESIKWMKVASSLPWRTNKQVRERYLNFLSPCVNRSPLSSSEFKRLIEAVQSYSCFPRIPWKKISIAFPGRSDIFLKNQYCHARGRMKKNLFEADLEKMEQDEFQKLLWDDFLTDQEKYIE
jgi:hypothetical protein